MEHRGVRSSTQRTSAAPASSRRWRRRETSVHNQILNVGAPGANYQISELAKVVADVFPGSDVSLGTRGGETRSYRVSFDKIRALLPAFQPQWDIERGAVQLHDVFEQVSLTREQFEGRDYVRLARSSICSPPARSTRRTTGALQRQHSLPAP